MTSKILMRCLLATALCFALLLPSTASAVVISAKNPSPTIATTPTVLQESIADIEQSIGRKLTWRERLGLKIIGGKLGKALRQAPKWLNVPPSVACAKIMFKNGETKEVDVLQISATEVKYRRCGFPNDPEIVESKSNILSVTAADGGSLFKNDGPNPTGLRTERWAILAAADGAAAWLLGLIGSPWTAIACAIAAIVFGIKSLRNIRKEPQKYGGRGWAIAGLILGGLFMFVLVIGLAAILGGA